MARLVIVSNRIALPKPRETQAGGLAVVIKEALTPGTLWLGWSGRTTRHLAPEPTLMEARGVTYAALDLPERDFSRFYAGFANGTLWPLLHARLGLMDYDRAQLESYVSINRTFARALAPLLSPDQLIWVHDYHLIPLGAELRALGVHNRIGFFLHVPFVPASIFGVLPCAPRLLRDLAAYDLIGLQTEQHLRDLGNSMVELLGATVSSDGRIDTGERVTRAVANPVGIDATAFSRQAANAAQGTEATRLHDSLVGRALIIGVDRLDYSKGLPNRFHGYDRFLRANPAHHLKVSYLQVAAASRGEVRQYRTLRRELDRLAGEINGRFAEFDWVPLRYMTRALPRSTLAGFYRLARVGLVTPLRDGMNLVAKEYVAAQDPRDPSVLVLSCFAGAAERMGDALMVNPFDADEIAEAIARALEMPLAERQWRYQSLLRETLRVTAKSYCEDFVAQLAEAPQSGGAETETAIARALAPWRGTAHTHS